MSAPICKHCGKTLVKSPKESTNTFYGRTYCGRPCYIAATKLVIHPKPCLVCKRLMHAHPGERLAAFRDRQTCGHRCGHALLWARRKNKAIVVPRAIVYRTEEPEEWLKHHTPTKCPTRYAAPVYSQHLNSLSIRRDGRVR